jgi:hypothetical protein
MTALLQLVGASLLVLAVAHLPLWRIFAWRAEIAQLSPLTARVFVVHLAFIVLLLFGLGLLLLCRPELLVERSELARLLLYGLVVFWVARLVAQPFVFDPVLARGHRFRTPLRIVATLGWSFYVAVFVAALLHQVQP